MCTMYITVYVMEYYSAPGSALAAACRQQRQPLQRLLRLRKVVCGLRPHPERHKYQ